MRGPFYIYCDGKQWEKVIRVGFNGVSGICEIEFTVVDWSVLYVQLDSSIILQTLYP